MEQPCFVFFFPSACQGNHEGRVLRPSRPSLSTSTAFTEGAHSLERWPAAAATAAMSSSPGRKTGEEGGVACTALLREGKGVREGSTGAPVKTPVLGFHSFNWV